MCFMGNHHVEGLFIAGLPYNPSQKLLAQLRKTMLCHKPQAIENSFKRPYGEVEDNIIKYIYKDLILKT